jgi:hypothetical protein
MTKWLRLHRRDLIAISTLLLVTLLFHWPLITPNPGRRQSYPAGDFYNQFYAFASYKHDRLWAGEIPLWNPYTYGGHPFLADVQAAVFYPPGLLVMLLSGPNEFSPQWLVVEAIVHFFLGASFTYLFVRRMTVSFAPEVSIAGALISALTFAFGGYLTGYPPLQLAILETQIWLPLILLFLDIGLSERRWGFVLGAGGVWGVALLAGHPQSAMYVFYGAVLYGLFRSWQARLSWHWAVVAHVVWVSVGFGLAAVQLLPAYEFMRLSVRAGLSYEELAGGFGFFDLVQYLLPGVFTNWSPVYVGIYALLLAGAACLGVLSPSWRRKQTRAQVFFCGVLAVVCLILSLGGKTFLYRLFYWIVPGFRLFRSQERAIYLTSLALSVLAGYGGIWLLSVDADDVWLRRVRRGALIGSICASGVLATVCLLGWTGWLAAGREWLGPLARWAGVSWVGWALTRWMTGRRSWWVLLSVVLVVIDLFSANLATNLSPGRANDRVYDSGWLSPVLEDGRVFRIVNDFGLPGNAGCWLRLEDMAGASPLRLQVHKAIFEGVPRWRMWELFDVRYIATWEHDLPGPHEAVRVAMQGVEWEKNSTYVHRLESDFARAWIVHRVQQVSGQDAADILASPEFDPFAEVLLTEPVSIQPNDPTEPSTVVVVDYAPEEIAIQANLSAAGWLVLGEWYYPGWRVWVDGERKEVLRADYALRAVQVDGGLHEIVFRYRPVSVYVGASISALVFVAVVGLVAFCLFRDTRGRAHGMGDVLEEGRR